jgi:hypothetical protein
MLGCMRLLRPFTDHPEYVGETYAGHCVRAFRFGGRMAIAGMACMIHALLPFLFVDTASRALDELKARLPANRASQ